jgi:Sulfotransferase domain
MTAATTSRSPVTVLYVAGVGRSGSTLLESLLGSLPGWIGVGETMHLPERGLRDDQRCGCGEVFSQCAFWGAVGGRAFGGWSSVDVDRWLELAGRVDRNRNLPLLLRPTMSKRFLDEHRELVDRCGSVVVAAAREAAADVVVESSKHPSFGLVLGAHPELDVRVVHVVRDSRGVAYSWTKKIRRPEITDRVEYMPTYAPARIAGRWFAWNGALTAMASRTRRPTLRVRYEDFVRSPHSVLRTIAEFAGRGVADEAIGALLTAGPNRGQHSVAGNPLRFAEGPVELRVDDQWRRDLPARQRRIVTTLTAPLLRLYGYRLRGGVA